MNAATYAEKTTSALSLTNLNSNWRKLLRQMERRFPNEFFLEPDVLKKYAGDKWFAARLPDAVALPRTTATVSAILSFANKHAIPVTARGAGVGYVGGCVPANGGIVLSMEQMKRIKQIDADDFVAVVEPGVITGKLQKAVEAKGLYYPPDPASRADCTIAGNIATNAGGPRCLKYGVTRDYVLGVEVVLADGTVVRLGSRTHKNKTGFDLTRLFVGSEGMLGIITEATLKLLPLPPYRASLSVGFETTSLAARAIRKIFRNGHLPAALEIADTFTLRAAEKRTGNKMLSGCRAHLIVELDGQKSSVTSEIRQVQKLLRELNPVFINCGVGSEACERIWQLRREFSYSLRDTGLTKLNQDIAVPRGRLEELLRFAEKLQKQHDLPIACFGHAGDGNIHVNVMVDFTRPGAERKSKQVLEALFKQVLAWGGVITGEHGIGIAKKPWWRDAVTSEAHRLHLAIKQALDPKGILNPGKFLG